jgi:two-component system, LytTR family, response regulator
MTPFKTTFRCLIVDDEELARAELRRQMTGLLPSLTIFDAGNIKEAREKMLTHSLDCIFLDLELPGGHGMTLLPEIKTKGIPVIVTTAHEQFAVDAFDADATDYLLKPIEKARLARAISRIPTMEEKVDTRVIVLGDQSNCWPLHSEEIIMAESEGSYVKLHLKDRKPILLTRTLKEIEHLLCPPLFVRVNRSQIVQLHHLKHIRRREGGCYSADLDGHGVIEFSRRQAQAFRQRFDL